MRVSNMMLSPAEVGAVTGLSMEKARVWKHRGYPVPEPANGYSFGKVVQFACLGRLVDHGIPPSAAAYVLSQSALFSRVAEDQEYEESGLKDMVGQLYLAFHNAKDSTGADFYRVIWLTPEDLLPELAAARAATILDVTSIRREVAEKIKGLA